MPARLRDYLLSNADANVDRMGTCKKPELAALIRKVKALRSRAKTVGLSNVVVKFSSRLVHDAECSFPTRSFAAVPPPPNPSSPNSCGPEMSVGNSKAMERRMHATATATKPRRNGFLRRRLSSWEKGEGEG